MCGRGGNVTTSELCEASRATVDNSSPKRTHVSGVWASGASVPERLGAAFVEAEFGLVCARPDKRSENEYSKCFRCMHSQ